MSAAPWLMLSVLVGVAALLGTTGWNTWLAWRRLRMARTAAGALLDVHAERLESSVAAAGERSETVASDGATLARSLDGLRRDVAHARWMFEQVPEQRQRLQDELVALILPTDEAPGDG